MPWYGMFSFQSTGVLSSELSSIAAGRVHAGTPTSADDVDDETGCHGVGAGDKIGVMYYLVTFL
jgi:hypothetical protein